MFWGLVEAAVIFSTGFKWKTAVFLWEFPIHMRVLLLNSMLSP